MYFILKE